jgi:ferredoxin-NADP reductase
LAGAALAAEMKLGPDRDIYVAGNADFVQEAHGALLAAGVPKDRMVATVI